MKKVKKKKKEKKYENNFNYLCEKHSIKFNSYCDSCKSNICYKCIKEHNSHKIIPFKIIGFNETELKQIKTSINEFENCIDKFKIDIKNHFENIDTLMDDYISIYENDNNNNYKSYYIKQFKYLREFISNPNLINLFDINPDIICEYDSKGDKEIKILSCYEEAKKEEKDLEGMNNVKNMREMFYNCSSLPSLNLSNFNTNNVKNMSWMFYYCSSLISLNLYNIKTNNVTNMKNMFFNCSSLTSLNLSNFNTNNVNDMSFMFYN